MSKYHRVAVLAAWILAVAFLFSSAIPAALADGNAAPAKAAKKAERTEAGRKEG